MGRDKAGLMIGGEPLWQRQLATLRALHAAELFISGRTDGPYAAAGVEIVPDARLGCGPIGGIEAVLRRAASPLVLVLAIDLPAMTAEFLESLLQQARAFGSGVVPQQASGWFEPLAAAYPRSALALVEDCLRGTDHSLQHFVQRAIAAGLVRAMPLSREQLPRFHNVNAPADL
ncbi:MAG: molybdenum cofactor guanylyltransferase [Chthoniobacter sp.]|nr:molybdenum cofactor guanylyltransferase [Chthoniobacter sp.]